MSVLANTDLMFHTATYWAPPTPDGFGGGTYPAPVEIACRWEDKPELFIDAEGREQQSAAVVYPDRELLVEGWLVQGSSAEADPHNAAGAFEIKAARKITSLRNDCFEIKTWV